MDCTENLYCLRNMWGVSSIQVMASSCSREESREWREGGAREGWREGEGREVAAKNWEMTRRLEWATAAWRGRAAVGAVWVGLEIGER